MQQQKGISFQSEREREMNGKYEQKCIMWYVNTYIKHKCIVATAPILVAVVGGECLEYEDYYLY